MTVCSWPGSPVADQIPKVGLWVVDTLISKAHRELAFARLGPRDFLPNEAKTAVLPRLISIG